MPFLKRLSVAWRFRECIELTAQASDFLWVTSGPTALK